jgi:hypothetical protein
VVVVGLGREAVGHGRQRRAAAQVAKRTGRRRGEAAAQMVERWRTRCNGRGGGMVEAANREEGETTGRRRQESGGGEGSARGKWESHLRTCHQESC